MEDKNGANLNTFASIVLGLMTTILPNSFNNLLIGMVNPESMAKCKSIADNYPDTYDDTYAKCMATIPTNDGQLQQFQQGMNDYNIQQQQIQ